LVLPTLGHERSWNEKTAERRGCAFGPTGRREPLVGLPPPPSPWAEARASSTGTALGQEGPEADDRQPVPRPRGHDGGPEGPAGRHRCAQGDLRGHDGTDVHPGRPSGAVRGGLLMTDGGFAGWFGSCMIPPSHHLPPSSLHGIRPTTCQVKGRTKPSLWLHAPTASEVDGRESRGPPPGGGDAHRRGHTSGVRGARSSCQKNSESKDGRASSPRIPGRGRGPAPHRSAPTAAAPGGALPAAVSPLAALALGSSASSSSATSSSPSDQRQKSELFNLANGG